MDRSTEIEVKLVPIETDHMVTKEDGINIYVASVTSGQFTTREQIANVLKRVNRKQDVVLFRRSDCSQNLLDSFKKGSIEIADEPTQTVPHLHVPVVIVAIKPSKVGTVICCSRVFLESLLNLLDAVLPQCEYETKQKIRQQATEVLAELKKGQPLNLEKIEFIKEIRKITESKQVNTQLLQQEIANNKAMYTIDWEKYAIGLIPEHGLHARDARTVLQRPAGEARVCSLKVFINE